MFYTDTGHTTKRLKGEQGIVHSTKATNYKGFVQNMIVTVHPHPQPQYPHSARATQQLLHP